MTDDGTYFWPESDGWHLTTGFQILGPFKSFNAALTRYRLIRLAA
jgi:hypothetical protein